MDGENLVAELKKHFSMKCLKCGSENLVLSFNKGTYWSTLTGADPDDITGGCNDCKKNDLFIYTSC